MDSELQRIEQAISAAPDPARKLELYRDLMHLVQSIDEAKFTRYFRAMMRLAKHEGSSLHQAIAVRYRGLNFLQHGNLDKSYRDLTKAASMFTAINERSFDADIHRTLGIICDQKGDFAGALHNFYLSLRLAEESPNDATILPICLNLGTFYLNRLSDYKKALGYFQRTYKNARIMERWQAYVISCVYIAECYLYLENIPKSKTYLDRGIRIAEKKNLSLPLLYLKATLGKYYKRIGDYAMAASLLEEVVGEAEKRAAYILVSNESINLADCYLRLRKWKNLNKALRLHEKLKTTHSLQPNSLTYLRLQLDIAKQKKEYPKAIRYLEKLVKIQEEDYKRDWQQKMDILEQSFKMENYKKDKEVAERVAQMRMDFLSNMSHEIRSPMNAVLGLTNVLLRKNNNNSNTANLQTIKSSTEHLLNVINDILDLSKIDAGKLNLERTSFNIRTLLTTVRQSAELKAAEKNLKLHFQVASNVPAHISGDAARITQILLNLVNNALKFTEKGGVYISLTCETKQRGKNIKLLFTVRDTGIGMSKEQIAALFRPYEQAEEGTYRKFGGTGLGLHISRQLAELMGGSITLESKNAKGSVFRFVLPVLVSTQEQKATKENDYSKLHNKTFLLADDNERDLDVLRQTLEEYVGSNLRLLTADNGKKALQLLQLYHKQSGGKQIDFVLTDLNMPEMDGFHLAKEVKKLYPTTTVVAVTSILVTLDKAQMLSEGFDAMISKPFKAEKLLEQLLRFV